MELSKEQKVIQQVVSKAWNDPVFKKELIAAPAATIEKLTGEKITLPKGKTLAVYDQSNPDVICLNIPPQPDFDDVELTDAELELVAGGVVPYKIIEGCIPPIFPPIFEPVPIIPITYNS